MKKIRSFGQSGLLRSIAALLVVLVFAGTFMVTLSGCSASNKLYMLAYGDYFDPDVIDDFEQKYGIKVVYDSYAAPEDLYAKLVSGATRYDVICASDYIVEKLINEDKLAKLNYDNIPNHANIDSKFVELTKVFDKEAAYSIPHFWGTLGILYDTTVVPESDLDSWNILFDEKYSGNIIMPNSERDAMFVALRLLGYSLNTTDKNELDKAAEMLTEQKPLVQAYLLDESARSKVVSGNAAMAVIYNGEAFLAMEENENLDFVIPGEGTYFWMDSLAIPANAPNPAFAEQFLDYLCGEEAAGRNFEYIYYSTPNAAVTENLDQEVLDIEAIFPDDAIFENGEVFSYLGKDTEEYYSYLWRMIKSA